jgi:hypothetical protein
VTAIGLLLVALTFDQAVVVCRGEARKDDMFFDAFAKPIARAEDFGTESREVQIPQVHAGTRT